MIRIRPSAVPAMILPPSTRGRLLGTSSLMALSGAMATAPRPSLASLKAETDALDRK